jgi:hypothetical protein
MPELCVILCIYFLIYSFLHSTKSISQSCLIWLLHILPQLPAVGRNCTTYVTCNISYYIQWLILCGDIMPFSAYCCVFVPNKPQLMCLLVLLDYPIIVGVKVHVLCSLFVHMFVREPSTTFNLAQGKRLFCMWVVNLDTA